MTHMSLADFACPTVRVAPPDVLADRARRDPGLRSVVRLAEWAIGRRVTRKGLLTLAEARRAVTDLHLPGDQGPDVAPARTAEDFEELDELWWLAAESGLLDVADTPARPGPLLGVFREDTDAVWLAAWMSVLRVAVEALLSDGSEVQLGALLRLYLGSAPVPMTDLVLDAAMTTDAAALPAGAQLDVVDVVDVLKQTGAAGEDYGGVRLTPLGVFGINQMLREIGVDAPSISDLGRAAAAEMFDLAAASPDSDGALATFDEWVGARDPGQAARELIEYAMAGGARERARTFGMLDRIGRPADAAVRALVDQPGIGAYAASWLAGQGRPGPSPTPKQGQWLLVDSLIANRDEHPQLIRQFVAELHDADVSTVGDLVGLVNDSGHDEAAGALALLAEHHPDPAVARRARKATMSGRGSAKSSAAEPLAADGDRAAAVYQLKITLKQVKPPVWRRILVPGTITLADLHLVIQLVMGWTNSHLHAFEAGGFRFGVPDPEYDWGSVTDEHAVHLSEVVDEGERMTYTYDFGDDWDHDVRVEKVSVADPAVQLPRCLTGRRACPPEDVGGAWGYLELLEAVGDPAHPDHEHMVEWVGEEFDAAHFDVDEVNDVLRGWSASKS